ncbi:MAG: 3-deoxy-D-manno-octulosonic acid transferase [Nitrospirae bacterium]|nr:3-deoxy-D-manno-octulosonic acid transferase [Nitrospirota bacterium]
MILRLIYSILYSFVIILLLPFQYKKRPVSFRHRWLKEKFGFISSAFSLQPSALIWIHAVSVGEVIAAIPLLRKLKGRFPDINLLVSTITDTGQKIAIERVPAGTQVIYLPFDLAFILKMALKNTRPDLFITMETELWPNLFMTLKKQAIPIIIMNGRLSDKSFKGYMRIRFFMRDIIECVALFGMQDTLYAQRIVELGAPKDRVKVLGNFKFDTMPSENIPEWTKFLTPPVIIAGSTHRGEEDLIISAFERLKTDFPELNLIIVPRHPERFGEVENLVKTKGLAYIKRSEIEDAGCKMHDTGYKINIVNRVSCIMDRVPLTGHVVILDTVGELASVYSIADIAIIGGSFMPHGGQNLLEPAYWAKPIIFGPHMENFPFAKEFYKKDAAIETNESGLFDEIKGLLNSPEKRKAIGERGKELYNEKAGSVERAINEIERYLGKPRR